VSDQGNNRIVKLQDNGSSATWITSIFVANSTLQGLDYYDCNGIGDVYVIDERNCQVRVFDMNLVSEFYSYGSCGEGTNQFLMPYDIHISKTSNEAIVSDAYSTSTGLQHFNIVPTVRVLEPGGWERLNYFDSPHRISWDISSSDPISSPQRIFYRLGVDWHHIADLTGSVREYSWTVPYVPTPRTSQIRVESQNLCGRLGVGISSNFVIYYDDGTPDPKEPRACPYIYSWDGTNYNQDNTLLSTLYETDFYKLEQPLVEQSGKYKLQIQEFEQEHSYFDQIYLLAVDHPINGNIEVMRNGTIVPYQYVTSPVYALDQDSVDQLSKVQGIDTLFFAGDSGSILNLGFSPPGDDSVFILKYKGKPVCYPPPCFGVKGGIDIGKDVGVFFTIHPRENWATLVINIRDHISNPAQSLPLNLTWKAEHELDVVGLTKESTDSIIVQECPLLEATHSIGVNVWDRVQLDSFFAELFPNQLIDLTFNAPEPTTGMNRSFVLVSKGYYESDTTGGEGQSSKEIESHPRVFSLNQNAPNPFISNTTFRYGLPVSTQVNIKIYDIAGRLVKSLVNEKKKAGYYTINWKGKDSNNRKVSSGIYFYRIKAGNYEKTRKMVFFR
jgi:hypothetical protein